MRRRIRKEFREHNSNERDYIDIKDRFKRKIFLNSFSL